MNKDKFYKCVIIDSLGNKYIVYSSVSSRDITLTEDVHNHAAWIKNKDKLKVSTRVHKFNKKYSSLF